MELLIRSLILYTQGFHLCNDYRCLAGGQQKSLAVFSSGGRSHSVKLSLKRTRHCPSVLWLFVFWELCV